MKRIVPFILLLISIQSFSQNITYQRLRARKIKDYVILRIEDIRGAKQITREIETKDGTIKSHPLKDGELYLASTESSFNIIFEFLNPLLYKIEIQEQTAADPIYNDINTFFDALTDLVQVTQKLPNTPFKTNTSVAVNSTSPATPSSSKNLEKYIADDILDWQMWEYKYEKDPLGFFDKEKMYEVYNEINQIDDFLNNQKFEGDLKEIIENLKSAKTISEFRTTLAILKDRLKFTNKKTDEQANSVSTKLWNQLAWNFKEVKIKPNKITREYLDNYNAVHNTNIKKIDSLKKQVQDSIERYDRGTIFKRYTENKLQNYLASAKKIIEQRKEIIKRMEEFSTSLESFLQTQVYTCKSSCEYIKGGVVEFDDDEIDDVSVVIKIMDFDIDNYRMTPTGDIYKALLKVSNYTSVIPELATGVVYTDVSFPKYGIDTDTNKIQTVTDAGSDRLTVLPSLVLNLVINRGYGPAYPMFQLGVGTGKIYPTILVGGGTRIFSFKNSVLRNLSLSFGGVWHWKQQLSTLKIGQQVTGTSQISNDLAYVFQSTPALYVGIHVNF